MPSADHKRFLTLSAAFAGAASLCLLPLTSRRSPPAKPPASTSLAVPSARSGVASSSDRAEPGNVPAAAFADEDGQTHLESARVFADALARVLTESDSEERETRICAALYAWARDDLAGASTWARTATILPRAKAFAAVINGAGAADAAAAIRFVEQLSASDAEHAGEYGSDLIFALGQAGHEADAARWAEANPTVNIDWLTGAFERWASSESEAALLYAVAMSDPVKRRAAVDAAISGWSKTEPKSLADYAANFPDGPEKNLAVVTALRAWADTDPKATADWMIAHRGAIASVPNLATINDD